MKTFPVGLDVLLATGEYVFADLYDFTLMDSSHLRYTTADTDIYFAGYTYTSKGPFFDVINSQSRGHWKAGLDLDTWQITIAPSVADPVTGTSYPAEIFNQPWMTAVRVGALDGATVDIHRVYLSAWPLPWTSPIYINNCMWNTNDRNESSVLSNHNLTIALAPGSSYFYQTAARATRGQTTGKFYCEATIDIARVFPDFAVGCVTAARSLVDYPGGSTNGFGIYNEDAGGGAGELFYNDPTGLAAIAGNLFNGLASAGDIISLAFDITNKLVWVRRNNNNWNNDGAADPATGTNGIALAAASTAAWYPACDLVGTPGQQTWNFGATAFTYTVPSGFVGWDNDATTPTTVQTYALMDLFAGRVAGIECGRTAASITINSWIEMLQRPMPRNVFGSSCRWTLFDDGCQLTRASFATNVTIGTVTNDAVFVISPAAAVSDYYAQGMITFTSGLNAPFSRSILADAGPSGLLTMRTPFPYQVSPGDTATVYPGCDKTQSTCLVKFSNLNNFGGFPFIPTPESAA